jgi:hypothetical protein
MRNLTYQSYYSGDLLIDGTRIYGQNGPEFPEIIINAELDLSPYESSGDTLGASSDKREQFPYTVTDLTGELRLQTEPSSRSQTRSELELGGSLHCLVGQADLECLIIRTQSRRGAAAGEEGIA